MSILSIQAKSGKFAHVSPHFQFFITFLGCLVVVKTGKTSAMANLYIEIYASHGNAMNLTLAILRCSSADSEHSQVLYPFGMNAERTEILVSLTPHRCLFVVHARFSSICARPPLDYISVNYIID